MPLTLEEIESLIGALGVVIPPEFIENKRREGEFKKRAAEIEARQAEMKQRRDGPQLEEQFKRAEALANQDKSFLEALKLLDEVERQLEQPDVGPSQAKAPQDEVRGAGESESAVAESAALLETQARVAALKQSVEKQLAEADAAVKAINEPSLQAPEAQKLEGLSKRYAIALEGSDPAAREQELSDLLLEIAQCKQDAGTAAGKAEELKASRMRVTEKQSAVDFVLAGLQKVIDEIEDKTIREGMVARLAPLTQERDRTTTLAVPEAQEAALAQLDTDAQALKADADKAAIESAALLEARARVAVLQQQVEKKLAEADAAVKAITEPSLLAPEAQKLDALSKRHTNASAGSDPVAQEQEFSALLVDITQCEQDATAAKLRAEELKATQLRVAEKQAAVDLLLDELQRVIDSIQEKTIKDGLVARQTRLTQVRAVIPTQPTADAQEAGLAKLDTAVQKVKAEADGLVVWDEWFKSAGWERWSKAAKDLTSTLKEAAAKATLTAELVTLQKEKNDQMALADYDSIKNTTYPKLTQIVKTARDIILQGPEVDLELHHTRNLMVAVRDEVTDQSVFRPFLEELRDLLEEKKTSWPTGGGAAEMKAGITDFNDRVLALRERAENARGKVLGQDTARLKRRINEIKAALKKANDGLEKAEEIDFEKLASEPALASADLPKWKAEFGIDRQKYEELSKRLKAVGKIRNREKRGRELVALGKASTALAESVLKREMKIRVKLGETKVIDEEIAAMDDVVDDPAKIAECKARIEARFGIKIEVGDEFKAKSLPRIGKMLARVPEWQVRQAKTDQDGKTVKKSFKTLAYRTEPSTKENYYQTSRNDAKLKGGKIGLQAMTEKGGANDNQTVVADSGKAVETSYFDFTTLHEIGHAVDDRINFMGKRMNTPGYGDWKKETFESALAAFLPSLVADCTGDTKQAQAADLEAMLAGLIKTGECTKPANPTDKLGSLLAEWDQINGHAVVDKLTKYPINAAAKPWDKGKAHAEGVQLGGRVYQEAYDGDWYSYSLADRASTGVTTYQWRAPGEWFAEIYALFYLDKLEESHPMSSWFQNEAKSEAEAAKV